MANFNSNPGNGSFVSRTMGLDVGAKHGFSTIVKSVNSAGAGEIYEPTGSNISTAFMVVSSSAGDLTSKLTAVHGGDINFSPAGTLDNTDNLTEGVLYPIALNYVSASGGTKINLFR